MSHQDPERIIFFHSRKLDAKTLKVAWICLQSLNRNTCKNQAANDEPPGDREAERPRGPAAVRLQFREAREDREVLRSHRGSAVLSHRNGTVSAGVPVVCHR